MPNIGAKQWEKPVALMGFGNYASMDRCAMMTLKPGAYISMMQVFWEESNGVTGINLKTDNEEQLMVGKEGIGQRAVEFYKDSFPFDDSRQLIGM